MVSCAAVPFVDRPIVSRTRQRKTTEDLFCIRAFTPTHLSGARLNDFPRNFKKRNDQGPIRAKCHDHGHGVNQTLWGRYLDAHFSTIWVEGSNYPLIIIQFQEEVLRNASI